MSKYKCKLDVVHIVGYILLYCTVDSRDSSFHLCSCQNVHISVKQYICWGWAEPFVHSLSKLPHGSQHTNNVVRISIDTVNLALFFHGLQVYLSLSLSLSLFLQHCLPFFMRTGTLTCCLFIVLTWLVCSQLCTLVLVYLTPVFDAFIHMCGILQDSV